MNVYDKANDLARAIKESDEFNRYKKAAEIIDKNEEHKKMIKVLNCYRIHAKINRSSGNRFQNPWISFHFSTIFTSEMNMQITIQENLLDMGRNYRV